MSKCLEEIALTLGQCRGVGCQRTYRSSLRGHFHLCPVRPTPPTRRYQLTLRRRLFSLIYVFDALRARNIIQLVLHLIFNTCIWVYSILQVPQTEHALSGLPADRCGSFAACVGPNSLFTLVKKLFIVTPVVLGLCTVGFAVLIRMLYVEFGWAVFHLVGASPDMKSG